MKHLEESLAGIGVPFDMDEYSIPWALEVHHAHWLPGPCRMENVSAVQKRAKSSWMEPAKLAPKNPLHESTFPRSFRYQSPPNSVSYHGLLHIYISEYMEESLEASVMLRSITMVEISWQQC